MKEETGNGSDQPQEQAKQRRVHLGGTNVAACYTTLAMSRARRMRGSAKRVAWLLGAVLHQHEQQ